MMKSVMFASTAVMLSVAIMLVITGRTTRGEFRSGQTSGESYWEVAQGLGRMGIRPGDKVAALGTSFEVYWARLARVRVVAEIPDGSVPEFWAADPTMKSKAIAVLFSTGAKAIVAADVPRTSGLVEWQSIGTTGFFVYSLSH
jgi:hypothetical protein